MIIKDKEKKVRIKGRSKKRWGLFIGLLLLGVSAAILIPYIGRSFWAVSGDGMNWILLANAEKRKGDEFVYKGKKTSGAAAQSKDYVFDGNYSVCAKASTQQYVFSTEIKNLIPNQFLFVRVWRYTKGHDNGCIAVSSLDNQQFYQQSCRSTEEKRGWKCLKLRVKVPEGLKDSTLKIFCYNPTEEPVYFDALSYAVSSKSLSDWSPKTIDLAIKEGEYKQLKQNRLKALWDGILITNEDSWVKGAIQANSRNEDKIKVKLRLKGDWLDHLKGKQWSFRVETEPTKAWNRLKTFSLQHPKTRAFLKEWLLHQWYNKEDVLTTRYDFVNLNLNNQKLGLYVYEEHFLKQIPEYNLKREGPILKFTENGLWEHRLMAQKMEAGLSHEGEKANPEIRPFKEGKTVKSPNLAQQFKIAQNLLYEYQHGLKPLKEVFDLDLLAKYYAIMDVAGAHHGAIWHNQRFYYNPVIAKLEPIGFDGYDETGKTWVYFPFLGFYQAKKEEEAQRLFSNIFQDWDFLRKYNQYLLEFSDKKYVRQLVSQLQYDLDDRLLYIQGHQPDYNYNTDYLFRRAAAIQLALMPNSNSLQSRTVEKGLLALCNQHPTAVEIVGSSSTKEAAFTKLDSSCILPSISGKKLPDFSARIKVPAKAKFLVYRVLGLEELHYAEINPWPVPQAFSPVQELQPNLIDQHKAYYYDKNRKRVVLKKEAIIDAPIVIPEDHLLIVEAGSKIDIINKAFILSYAPIQSWGTAENPIVFSSSDASANGVVIIKAKTPSALNHTTFTNFNTLSYKGWNLTGAVTFYESDVEIKHCVFTHNHCEDALNIVRSKFLFQSSVVSHTFSDGFDADFCEGMVDNGYFFKTGNDGIDFSTSLIEIQNTQIDSVGDKGISIGEQGTAIIRNTTVNGAVIGVASKDLSKVTIESIDLKNCQQGFSAYQKKPEYGGGFIYVDDYSAANLDQLHKIFPGSYLKLGDKEIKGD